MFESPHFSIAMGGVSNTFLAIITWNIVCVGLVTYLVPYVQVIIMIRSIHDRVAIEEKTTRVGLLRMPYTRKQDVGAASNDKDEQGWQRRNGSNRKVALGLGKKNDAQMSRFKSAMNKWRASLTIRQG